MQVRHRPPKAAFWVLLLVGLVLAACTTAGRPPGSEPAGADANRAEATTYANPELLLEPKALHALLSDHQVRVVDVRSPEDYQKGHIPGAVSVPLNQLSGESNGVAGMLIPAAGFQRLMQQAGVQDDTVVAIYDADTGMGAARLFWGLEYYGHQDKARVLNGGFAAWLAAGLPTEDGPETPPAPGTFVARTQTGQAVTLAEILAGLDTSDWTLLDVRSPEEYRGENVRALRGGHIPGAINLEWQQALTTGSDGVRRWKSAADLAALYETAGLSPDRTVVPYCQTNTRGAHAYFTLRLMGYPVRPYEGSWSEWGNNPDVPVTAGANP